MGTLRIVEEDLAENGALAFSQIEVLGEETKLPGVSSDTAERSDRESPQFDEKAVHSSSGKTSDSRAGRSRSAGFQTAMFWKNAST